MHQLALGLAALVALAIIVIIVIGLRSRLTLRQILAV